MAKFNHLTAFMILLRVFLLQLKARTPGQKRYFKLFYEFYLYMLTVIHIPNATKTLCLYVQKLLLSKGNEL